jgi:hypothetical protein
MMTVYHTAYINGFQFDVFLLRPTKASGFIAESLGEMVSMLLHTGVSS